MIREALELRRVFKIRKLPRNNLEELRNQKVRAVIRNAYDHVPYYRSLFRSARISPKDIETVADLGLIPVTTKEDLRDAGFENTVAGWVDRSSLITMRTSGTTGKPFDVHRSPAEWRIALAVNMAALMTCGFGPKDRLAILGPDWTLHRRLHHWLGLYRSEVIPLPVTADWQLKRLKDLQPTVVWTYPSVLRSLIHNLDYPIGELIRPRVVITVAEVFDPVLRRRVAAELDPEFFILYGAIEFGRIAWECPEHNGLHVNASHFVLERTDAPASPDLQGAGVTVLTSLFAFAMPFIRYKLGDIWMASDRKCSCGCTFPLIAPPIGREDDVLMLPDGQIRSANAFHHIMAHFDGIDQWRIIQESESDYVLQLVMPDKPNEETLGRMRNDLLKYLERQVSLSIRFVEFMEEEAFKFRTFISKAPRKKD